MTSTWHKTVMRRQVHKRTHVRNLRVWNSYYHDMFCCYPDNYISHWPPLSVPLKCIFCDQIAIKSPLITWKCRCKGPPNILCNDCYPIFQTTYESGPGSIVITFSTSVNANTSEIHMQHNSGWMLPSFLLWKIGRSSYKSMTSQEICLQRTASPQWERAQHQCND